MERRPWRIPGDGTAALWIRLCNIRSIGNPGARSIGNRKFGLSVTETGLKPAEMLGSSAS